MNTYTVKILTPGHMIIFKSKRSRSPVVFENVLESDLDILKIQAKRALLKFEVIKNAEEQHKTVFVEDPIEFLDDPKQENISETFDETEPKSILDKLLSNKD